MSSYYSAVDRRINADEWFRDLSIEKQWLWFRLLTGSHVTQVAGLWPVTEDGLARSFRISTKKFLTLFEAFEGRAFADWSAGVIYLPNALKIEPNQPRNEATLKGWIKPLELVPECRLRDRALNDFIAWILSEPKRFPNGVPAGFPRPKEPPSSPGVPPSSGTPPRGHVAETVSATVSLTVTETVSEIVKQTVTETMPSRARAHPRTRPNLDHETETDHEPTTTVTSTVNGQSGGSTEPARIRCPIPIAVPADTLGSLEMAIGLPRPVALKAILDFSLAWNAKTTDLRFPEQWVGSVVKALTGDWSDQGKRARMKAAVEQAPTDPAAARRRREAAEAAHAKRQEAELHRLASEVGATVVAPDAAREALVKFMGGH